METEKNIIDPGFENTQEKALSLGIYTVAVVLSSTYHLRFIAKIRSVTPEKIRAYSKRE